MKTILLIILFILHVSTGQKTSSAFKQVQVTPHCENVHKNTLIEHFFNIIFSEFHATPPVCVCVQMCPGEFTYCYPNGCFKGATNIRDEKNIIDIQASPPTTPVIPHKQFMVNEKYDFMTDFLEKNYVDDSKTGIPQSPAEQEIRPDLFKDKYSIVGRLKRRPKVELSYNIREQVRNSKSDGVDFTKTKWPLKHLMKVKMNQESDVTSSDKVTYFRKMFVDTKVGDNASKYFKRDLTTDDEEGTKFNNLFEYPMNGTDNASFALEYLIDTLIRNSVTKTKADGHQIATTNEPKNDTNTPIENCSRMKTSENIDLGKNTLNLLKSNTTNVTQKISYIEKQIDKNNTSMDIVKRTVENYEETESNLTRLSMNNSSIDTIVNSMDYLHTKVSIQKDAKIESTTRRGLQVTPKNRLRFIRKFPTGKFN